MSGGSTTELSKKYGISKSTVTEIKYKKVYKDILDTFPDIPKSTSRTKLTKDQIELIKQHNRNYCKRQLTFLKTIPNILLLNKQQAEEEIKRFIYD